jgi:hypothetical protein
MDLVGNDVDTLHKEIEHLVGHLVGNDVDTLYEERNHLVVFIFIRVYDCRGGRQTSSSCGQN